MIDVTCIMCLAVNNLIQQPQRQAEMETAIFIGVFRYNDQS